MGIVVGHEVPGSIIGAAALASGAGQYAQRQQEISFQQALRAAELQQQAYQNQARLALAAQQQQVQQQNIGFDNQLQLANLHQRNQQFNQNLDFQKQRELADAKGLDLRNQQALDLADVRGQQGMQELKFRNDSDAVAELDKSATTVLGGIKPDQLTPQGKAFYGEISKTLAGIRQMRSELNVPPEKLLGVYAKLHEKLQSQPLDDLMVKQPTAQETAQSTTWFDAENGILHTQTPTKYGTRNVPKVIETPAQKQAKIDAALQQTQVTVNGRLTAADTDREQQWNFKRYSAIERDVDNAIKRAAANSITGSLTPEQENEIRSRVEVESDQRYRQNNPLKLSQQQQAAAQPPLAMAPMQFGNEPQQAAPQPQTGQPPMQGGPQQLQADPQQMPPGQPNGQPQGIPGFTQPIDPTPQGQPQQTQQPAEVMPVAPEVKAFSDWHGGQFNPQKVQAEVNRRLMQASRQADSKTTPATITADLHKDQNRLVELMSKNKNLNSMSQRDQREYLQLRGRLGLLMN